MANRFIRAFDTWLAKRNTRAAPITQAQMKLKTFGGGGWTIDVTQSGGGGGGGVAYPVPDYDSGWFAVALNTLYTKAHGLGQLPAFVCVEFSQSNSPPTPWIFPIGDTVGVALNQVYYNTINIYIQTAVTHICYSYTSGYMRIRAWK